MSTSARRGDPAGLSRGFLRSLNREAAGKTRASAEYAVAVSPVRAPVPGAPGRCRFKGGRGGDDGGGAAGGSCHQAAAGASRGRAAPRPLARGTCPGDRPATSLEGALLKIRTKIQSQSVSGCAKWPGNFRAARRPRRRGRADGEGARAAQPGPARPAPPAAHPCDSGRGARRGSAGARPHAGGAPRSAAGRRPRGGGPEAGGAQRGPAGLHVRAGGGGRADRSRPAPSRAGRGARAGAAGRRRRPEWGPAGVSAGERAACMRGALAPGGRRGSAGSEAAGRGEERGARRRPGSALDHCDCVALGCAAKTRTGLF